MEFDIADVSEHITGAPMQREYSSKPLNIALLNVF